MIQYVTKYKCKLCGEEYESHATTTKDIAQKSLMHTVYGIKYEDHLGVSICLTEIHFCEDGSMGIGELLGIKQKEM